MVDFRVPQSELDKGTEPIRSSGVAERKLALEALLERNRTIINSEGESQIVTDIVAQAKERLEQTYRLTRGAVHFEKWLDNYLNNFDRHRKQQRRVFYHRHTSLGQRIANYFAIPRRARRYDFSGRDKYDEGNLAIGGFVGFCAGLIPALELFDRMSYYAWAGFIAWSAATAASSLIGGRIGTNKHYRRLVKNNSEYKEACEHPARAAYDMTYGHLFAQAREQLTTVLPQTYQALEEGRAELLLDSPSALERADDRALAEEILGLTQKN